MAYDVPGRADDLPPELVDSWNRAIADTFAGHAENRFFALEFKALEEPQLTDAVHWPGDPAEPLFCADDATAEALCDWGVPGRHALHNEYCEYTIISRPDGSGRTRPKRVEVTTELREYWVTVAKHDPELVRSMASEVLGLEVEFLELFGAGDPLAATEEERELAFCHLVAGNGHDERLINAGVPVQPTGRVNTERALFMTNPINGLDDLVGIVLFGAVPYARRDNGAIVQADRDEIFASTGRIALACRHADPAAALAAYSVAFTGGQVAFANPLGMYLRQPSFGVFSVGNDPVPEAWIRFGRGDEGMWQRLEFGPSDDDEAFLDDITVSVGASERPMCGGYQLVRQLEVGPLVVAGVGEPVADGEWQFVEPLAEPIACAESEACETVRALKRAFDAANAGRSSPRARGNGG